MAESKISPKDVFLHLLSIIALYISVGGLIALLFQYINLGFPDQLDHYSSMAYAIRWSMASLIVVFPVYIWVSRLLHKEYEAQPEKKELKIRKWLVHLTLFIAAIIIISDLVSLVYNFLGGDLTARFVLKVLSILLVIGGVFWYYLRDLKNSFRGHQLRTFAELVCLVVLVGVAVGFFTAGSPFTARKLRFDERRIGDLQTIQWQIINYWQKKDKLPAQLAELNDPINGFVAPIDPETNSSYEYKIRDNLSFMLCANFSLKTNSRSDPSSYPKMVSLDPRSNNKLSWDHPAGNSCFLRIIDPELYGSPKAKP